jgi:hypothetical protein
MTRLNTILSAVFIITAVMAFTSCERNEKMANVMSSGSGIWVIEKIHYTNYDTSGTVILDSVDTGVGEFVFFDSSTLSELYNYNACVFCEYDSTGFPSIAYPCEYFTDKYRFDIRNAPPYIAKTYTVEDWGSQKQTWVYTTNHPSSNTVSDLATQMRVYIKRK